MRQQFSIPAETLCSFLSQLEAAYKLVPYHNAAHGACVAHGAYWFACNPAIRGAASSPIEMFSLILAALMHDVGHTGSPRPNPRLALALALALTLDLALTLTLTRHNNAFHVATGSELALLYSDQSVLEMHHLATGFRSGLGLGL